MDDGEQGAEVLAEVTTSMTSSMDRASQGSVSNRESETRELSQELLLFSSTDGNIYPPVQAYADEHYDDAHAREMQTHGLLQDYDSSDDCSEDSLHRAIFNDEDDADGRESVSMHWSHSGLFTSGLYVCFAVAVLTTLLLCVIYLYLPFQATHPSPPILKDTACKSGQALLALTGTEPVQLEGGQLCVSEPVRWEAKKEDANCLVGGIRVALQEGGAAELCGVDNMSRPAAWGFPPASIASDKQTLVTTFIADKPVRSGQVVSLAPKGGVEPYQLFRNVVWRRNCSSLSTVSLGFNLLASLCTSDGPRMHEGPSHSLSHLELCRVRDGRALDCGLPVPALPPAHPAASEHVHEDLRVLQVVGAFSQVLLVSESASSRGVISVHVLAAHDDDSLSLTPVAHGAVPLPWERGEDTVAGSVLRAVFLSRMHFALIVARRAGREEEEDGEEEGGAGPRASGGKRAMMRWILCGIANQTQIQCGQGGGRRVRADRVVGMRVAVLERDRLAVVAVKQSMVAVQQGPDAGHAGGGGGAGRIEVTVLEGTGGGTVEEERLVLQEGVSVEMPGVVAGVGRVRGGEGVEAEVVMDVSVLTPSKIVVVWAAEGGGVEAAVAYVADDEAAVGGGVVWSRRVSVVSPKRKTAGGGSEGGGCGGIVENLWAVEGGLPDSLAIVVLRGHGGEPGGEVDGGGGERGGSVEGQGGCGKVHDHLAGRTLWQVVVDAKPRRHPNPPHHPPSLSSSSVDAAPSSASFASGLQVVGAQARIWHDMAPLALTGAAAVAIAPNLIVSLVVAGPWVAARMQSFKSAALTAHAAATAATDVWQLPAGGEGVGWDRKLLAHPVGVAVEDASQGAHVAVAVAGVVDGFAALVPGCMYVVDPDGSLRCANALPRHAERVAELDSAGVGEGRGVGRFARRLADGDVAYPMGRAANASAMVLEGPGASAAFAAGGA